MRLKAFVLFGKLAKVVGISKKHFFKGEVKRAWVSLLLHCQDPCPSVAQVTLPPHNVWPYDLEPQCPKEKRGLASFCWLSELLSTRSNSFSRLGQGPSQRFLKRAYKKASLGGCMLWLPFALVAVYS